MIVFMKEMVFVNKLHDRFFSPLMVWLTLARVLVVHGQQGNSAASAAL